MKDTDKIKKIATTYGYNAQSRQLIEEMTELTQAINKFWRNSMDCGKINLNKLFLDMDNLIENTPNYQAIVEEIADVEIMLEQIKYLLKVNDLVHFDYWKTQKLDRQIERIERENDR